MSVRGEGNAMVGRTCTRKTPLMMRSVPSRPSRIEWRLPVAGSASSAQIRVLHRTIDAAVERYAQEVGKTEVVSTLPEFVVQRRGKRREHAPAARDVRADGVALSSRKGSSVSENQQLESIEPIGRQKRFVNELERHPRFNQRVIHAAHVIVRAIAFRDAGMIRGGLLGVEQGNPRKGRFVSEITFVIVVPLVDTLDHGKPAPVVQHTGELRHPRAHPVRGAFRHPEPHFGFALHGVLPAIRLFESDAEDPADRRRPMTERYSFARRPFAHGGVTPRRAWLSLN